MNVFTVRARKIMVCESQISAFSTLDKISMTRPFSPSQSHLAFLSGGGCAADFIATRDWSATLLGGIADWSISLKSTIGTMVRSPTPMLLVAGGEEVLHNDACVTLLGDQHLDAIGVPTRESWREFANLDGQLLSTVLGGKTISHEDQVRAVSRGGRLQSAWFTLHYSAVLCDRDIPLGVLVVVVDTTDKVLAQRSLENERQRWTQVFEQSPGFMAMLTGPNHVFHSANPAYMQLIGNRDIVNRSVREALPDLTGQGHYEILDIVFSTGELFAGTAMPLSLQPTPSAPARQLFIDVVYQPMRDPDGKVFGIFAQGSDVTERQTAVFGLQESANQFRTFAQAQPNQIWTSPANGLLDWFSERVYEYSGAQPGELDGQGWSHIVHPDDLQAAAQRWAACLATGTNYDTEFRIRRKDGFSAGIWCVRCLCEERMAKSTGGLAQTPTFTSVSCWKQKACATVTVCGRCRKS